MDFKFENDRVVGFAEFGEVHASPDSSKGFWIGYT